MDINMAYRPGGNKMKGKNNKQENKTKSKNTTKKKQCKLDIGDCDPMFPLPYTPETEDRIIVEEYTHTTKSLFSGDVISIKLCKQSISDIQFAKRTLL